MSKDLEYNGRPELNRRRIIEEIPVDDIQSPAPAPDDSDPIDDATTTLFTNLGRTFLKGEVLKDGLRKMDPAQFIPINPNASQVAISATRLDEDGSLEGTIIPFTLYQLCVDILAEKQWLVRRIYDRPTDLPHDIESSDRAFHTESSGGMDGDMDNLLNAFLTGSGIAGAIICGLATQTIQNEGHQAHTLDESAAKAVFAAQKILGIVVLIELGVQVVEIVKMLLKAGDTTPNLEDVVNKYQDKKARWKILEENGFEPDKFYAGQSRDDAVTVLEYCSSYIQSHQAEGPVFDHWVAYGNVVARQNILRSALDSATQYSEDFSKMFDRDNPIEVDTGSLVANHLKNKPHSRIHSKIASHFQVLDRDSSGAYDEILNSFMFQISDKMLCCLVELFGTMDTGALRLIASLLRLAAIDIGASIAALMDGFLKLLVNAVAAVIYKIIARINKVVNDIAIRILEFLEKIDEALGFETEHCPTFADIITGIMVAIYAMVDKIEILLMEILNYIENLGAPNINLGFHIAAERRYLVNIAQVLDVIASRLDAASVCAHQDDKSKYEILLNESKDQAAHEIIHTLLEKSPPSIQVSDEDIKKYFPTLQASTSPTFGFTYGPKTVLGKDVGQRSDALNNCGVEMTEERKSNIKTEISNAMASAFGR